MFQACQTLPYEADLGHQSPQVHRLAIPQASLLLHPESHVVHPHPSHQACWPLGLQSCSNDNNNN